MKSAKELFSESFKSTVNDLTSKDIAKITGVKVYDSRFIKYDEKTGRTQYKIVSYDRDEDTYLVNSVFVTAYAGGKTKAEVSPMPDEEFESVKLAVAFMKRAK